MKRLLLPLVAMICSTAFGQKALTHFFPAGQADADQLVKGYITPMAEDLGTLASSGWYNTGATHSKFGFDISATMNAVFLTGDRKLFNAPSMTETDFVGTPNTKGSTYDQIPTIYGKTAEYPAFVKKAGAPNPLTPFVGPDGIDPQKTYGADAQILPTITVGFGLFANTDIRARYTPQQTINGVKTGTIGGAIIHDIKQHIPGLKMLPFSMSILLAYTKLNGSVDLSGTYSGSGQEGKIDGTSMTGQLLISKSLSIVTFYGGLGFVSSTTKFNVNGSYNVDHAVNQVGGVALDVPLTTSFTLTDPYKYSVTSSGFKATLGIRFKMGPFFLNGDYNFYQSQRLLSAGLGFTFR